MSMNGAAGMSMNGVVSMRVSGAVGVCMGDAVNVRMSDAVGVYMCICCGSLLCFHGIPPIRCISFSVSYSPEKKQVVFFVQCLYNKERIWQTRGYIGDIPLILREKRKGRNRKRMNLLDIIGPVMVGPSSSHTAGAVKIGRVSRKLLAEEVADAKIYFHGSFLATGKGHGTDKAILAGLLGMQVDDPRIPESFTMAKESGMSFTLEGIDLGDVQEV